MDNQYNNSNSENNYTQNNSNIQESINQNTYNNQAINEQELNNQKEQKNNNWIIYMLLVIVIIIVILLLLRGCNALRNKNNNKVVETNEWVSNMWNKCIDPIYWYTVDGTNVNSGYINIDEVLTDCDKYYNEYTSKKEEVDALDDNEYKEFKEYYNEISKQIEIIYQKIKINKPVAKEEVDYESNMETLYEYQVKLYNLVKENHLKG